MTTTPGETTQKTGPQPKVKVPGWLGYFPWKRFLMAAVPLALAFFYLTLAAPSLVPVPRDIRVPFPALLQYLEPACVWCGRHSWAVALIGLAVLAIGFFGPVTAPRYYLYLTIIASVLLAGLYLEISAPIDRLLHAVQENLPPERKLPEYLPENNTKTRDDADR